MTGLEIILASWAGMAGLIAFVRGLRQTDDSFNYEYSTWATVQTLAWPIVLIFMMGAYVGRFFKPIASALVIGSVLYFGLPRLRAEITSVDSVEVTPAQAAIIGADAHKKPEEPHKLFDKDGRSIPPPPPQIAPEHMNKSELMRYVWYLERENLNQRKHIDKTAELKAALAERDGNRNLIVVGLVIGVIILLVAFADKLKFLVRKV